MAAALVAAVAAPGAAANLLLRPPKEGWLRLRWFAAIPCNAAGLHVLVQLLLYTSCTSSMTEKHVCSLGTMGGWQA